VPSFSSTGSLEKVVTSLGINRIATMIMSGKPNRPFPEQFEVDLDEMSEGGKQAISVVSQCLERGTYDELEGLVSGQCISGLKSNLESLTPEERNSLGVKPEDIFFSFIPEFNFKQENQSLLLVTFWFPHLEELKEAIRTNRQEMDDKMKEILADAKEGKLEKGEVKESIKESLKESQAKLKGNDTHLIFQQNEIIIGNFRFERKDQNSQWTIVEMSQINSVNAWAYIFRKRWKGRLGISLRGVDFYKVLRYDYMTDWIAYTIIFNFLVASSLSGGMISAPHS